MASLIIEVDIGNLEPSSVLGLERSVLSVPPSVSRLPLAARCIALLPSLRNAVSRNTRMLLPSNAIAPVVGDTRAATVSSATLATLVFTDIVSATQTAAALGDRRWHDLLDQHHALIRREIARFGGREVDSVGDGFFVSFEGPARAVRCARQISHEVCSLGLTIRAGVHIGECEMIGAKPAGIAVHIASRITGEAGAGEVLVSSTVKDVVAGSDLMFEDRGVRSLRGVPQAWHLFAVKGEQIAAA